MFPIVDIIVPICQYLRPRDIFSLHIVNKSTQTQMNTFGIHIDPAFRTRYILTGAEVYESIYAWPLLRYKYPSIISKIVFTGDGPCVELTARSIYVNEYMVLHLESKCLCLNLYVVDDVVKCMIEYTHYGIFSVKYIVENIHIYSAIEDYRTGGNMYLYTNATVTESVRRHIHEVTGEPAAVDRALVSSPIIDIL